MDATIDIATTPSADTPGTTLVLKTPTRFYVFGNQAEGTQRALNEGGHRLTKVQDFFITGKTEWSNIGGLLGMALTLADASATAYESAMESYHKKKSKGTAPIPPKLNLYGPPNLKHVLATCRRFIFRKGLPLVATQYSPGPPSKTAEGVISPTWEDENIHVWAMSVAPSQAPGDNEDIEAALAFSRQRYDATLNQFDDHKPKPDGESDAEREIRYDQIRTEVLGHMFDSAWSFDTLVEHHISEVEMPTVMYLRNQETGQLEKYNGPMPGGAEPLPDIKVLTRTPWPGATVLSLPPTKPALEAVSYIVRTRKVRGKFDVTRARSLGLRDGRAYAILTSGTPVENDKGETITPDMVLGPDRPGQGVAILDVPSVGHLESLIQREEFTSSGVMSGIRAFVWILGPGVSRHPTLKDFMHKFDQVQHVISSADEAPNRVALQSVARQTIQLKQIDPASYNVPVHDVSTIPQKRLNGEVPQEGQPLSNVMIAERGLRFRLMPNWEIRTDEIKPDLDVSSIEASTSPSILESAEQARENIARDKDSLLAWRQLLARPDTEIITLGTGSALPSKYRNVSATLVRVPGIGNYLLDCGENTLGQLRRVFEPDELIEVLRDLRMIWISHLHADHHLGITSVIKAWYAVVHNSVPCPTPPTMPDISDSLQLYGLSVVSHDGMLKWLREYSAVEDFGYSRILPLQITPFAPASGSPSTLSLWPGNGREVYKGEHTLQRKDYEAVLGLSDIQACRVAHCYGAMAVTLTFPDAPEDAQSDPPKKPLKISYSGDCRPSGQFAQMGRDTTVLIHEATFDDEMQADAKKKKHSTTSEALGIGASMGAKAVVLTHFSQRYQRIPVLETVDMDQGEGVAADVLDAEAIATEDPPEEEEGEADADVEMGEAGVDVKGTISGGAEPALPTDQVVAPSKEKVIKVRAKDMKVAVAFDYMRLRIGEIARFGYYNAALNRLLSEEEEKGEEKDGGAGVGEEEGKVNGNGKKTSPKQGGGERKKKAKRRN
ncbi:uncharacterized protein EI97DRAFT_433059 [Westerdykella ornata]|uniref:ribonuclease Z n=1 Tax=Westerdykella ornata TaxID=318751 RepID=A0A6A6JMD8_WESOR|nr:uncharacterized protein EI97DRAFT_433059 [Westerdykella ornata]KAF2276826.1 hypothetical protein EI97DRAFT_433059 [Westerdykella ornata]